MDMKKLYTYLIGNTTIFILCLVITIMACCYGKFLFAFTWGIFTALAGICSFAAWSLIREKK